MSTDAERIAGLYERHALAWAGGCGFGKPIAAYLIAQGFAVCGVDSSTTMIAVCRKTFPDMRWIVGDMRTLDLGQRFDGIMAWDSFFHLSFDDQRHMFAVLMPTPRRAHRFCLPAAQNTARPSENCAASRSTMPAWTRANIVLFSMHTVFTLSMPA